MENKSGLYVPSHYTHLSNVYNYGEFLCIQKLLRSVAFNCHYNAKYPILKLLKAVCRRMLINEFESIFFAFVVQTNRWNINDEVIKRHWHQVRDIVCYVAEDVHYKSLTLYLLLCAYTVKYYLSENVNIYTVQMNKVCPGFKDIFEEWAKQYVQSTLKINPKMLNKVYNEIYLRQELETVNSDNNSLVDNLLQISPSYNPEKDKGELLRQSEAHRIPTMAVPSSVSSSLVANLTLISSSQYLQQIAPVGISIITSSWQQQHQSRMLANSGYGAKRRNIFENAYGNISQVNVGLTPTQSDNEELGVAEGTGLERQDSDGHVFRKQISTCSNQKKYIP